MPYITFQGDIFLISTMLVLALATMSSSNNKNIERALGVLLGVTVTLYFYFMIATEAVQLEISFYDVVVAGNYSPNAFDIVKDLPLVTHIRLMFLSMLSGGLYSIGAMFFGGLVTLFVVQGLEWVLKLFRSKLPDCGITLILGLTVVGIYAGLVNIPVFVEPASVRYIAVTQPVHPNVPKKIESFCSGANVAKVSGRRLTCGASIESGVLRDIQWAIRGALGMTEGTAILGSMRRAYEVAGMDYGDFELEITWDEEYEVVALYSFDKDFTPPASLPDKMDALADTILVSVQQALNDIKVKPSGAELADLEDAWIHRKLAEVR